MRDASETADQFDPKVEQDIGNFFKLFGTQLAHRIAQRYDTGLLSASCQVAPPENLVVINIKRKAGVELSRKHRKELNVRLEFDKENTLLFAKQGQGSWSTEQDRITHAVRDWLEKVDASIEFADQASKGPIEIGGLKFELGFTD